MLRTQAPSVTPCSPHTPKLIARLNSVDEPRKDVIDSLQKQIDFLSGEVLRLKYAQNTHITIFRMPTELLSEVFLYLVETGLGDGSADFVAGTFKFLQVCRHWKEVAVASPQLWVWWVAGAARAWRLFESRSKGAPLKSLAWRHDLPDSARDMLTDPAIPGGSVTLTSAGPTKALGLF